MTYAGLAALVLVLCLAVAVGAVVAESRAHRRPAHLVAVVVATAAVLTVLTVVFDSAMAAADLFRYDERALLGPRLGLAPVEDLAWPLATALLLPSVLTVCCRPSSGCARNPSPRSHSIAAPDRTTLAPPSAVNHSSARRAYFSASSAATYAVATTSTMPSSVLVPGSDSAAHSFAPTTAPVVSPTTNVANRNTSDTTSHASSPDPSATHSCVQGSASNASATRNPSANPAATSARLTERMP